MSKNRIFKETPKTRLIVSVEIETVAAIDRLIRYPSANRSEFVRLAIEEKLERDVVLFQNRASVAPKRICNSWMIFVSARAWEL
ncbi:hypothetical protein NL64_06830 [Pseudomonas fluorescens]|uniref:ribbon-helix-helix protein, CopG family n=1 Tax=Pseudomonas fluorescens TaxID=294 RepID=UPI00054BAEA0|nr:ribbon-helix-helix protein, CopG family [Pseudomonas fluorescens]KII34175.1 hypothetical protein NL64_06830 [Pseudomonas fluorescens]